MNLNSRAAALVAVVLTFGSGARAQSDAPASTPPSAPDGGEPSEVQSVPAAKPPETKRRKFAPPARPSAIDPGLRVAGEVVGATVVGALGVGAAFFWGADLFCTAIGQRNQQGCGFAAAFLSIPIGAFVGAPLGSWIMGDWLGGEGTFLGALVGAVIGVAIAVPLFIGSYALNIGGVLPLTPLLPIAGAVFGYEWSDSRARATTKVAAVPMLLPGGGGVALQGAF